MAKVKNPFFLESNIFLKFRTNKNLKGNFTHVVSIKRQGERKAVSKNDKISS